MWDRSNFVSSAFLEQLAYFCGTHCLHVAAAVATVAVVEAAVVSLTCFALIFQGPFVFVAELDAHFQDVANGGGVVAVESNKNKPLYCNCFVIKLIAHQLLNYVPY